MQVADAVERCLNGDRAAYEQVVVAHGEQLVGVLLRLLGNVEDARDVAQEAFVRAYQNLHRYDRRRPFKPWLFQIARNLAHNHLKARGRRPEGKLLGDGENALCTVPSETSSPVQAVLADERRAAVDRVLGRLRPEYREVLVLRYVGRLEYEEIAAALRIPVGTVKTWLNRAKGQFRKLADGTEIDE